MPTRNDIIEGGPSSSGVVLHVATVQFAATSSTNKGALTLLVVQGAAEHVKTRKTHLPHLEFIVCHVRHICHIRLSATPWIHCQYPIEVYLDWHWCPKQTLSIFRNAPWYFSSVVLQLEHSWNWAGYFIKQYTAHVCVPAAECARVVHVWLKLLTSLAWMSLICLPGISLTWWMKQRSHVFLKHRSHVFPKRRSHVCNIPQILLTCWKGTQWPHDVEHCKQPPPGSPSCNIQHTL